MINEINTSKCTGCGACVEICNMDVLRLNEKIKKAYIAYPEDCMTCFECALRCPVGAVVVSFEPEFTPESIIFIPREK